MYKMQNDTADTDAHWSLRRMLSHPLTIVLIIGLAIRLILGLLMTYNFDVTHWAQVVQNIRSGNGLYELDGYYYTPPWGYMLAFISSIGDLVGIGDLGARVLDALPIEEYNGWYVTATVTSISFNLLVKIPMFMGDVVVAYLIRWIVLHITENVRKANISFALWFLCPLTMVVSSVNGMFDTFSVMMVLLCVILLMKDRCALAGMMFSMAFLLKFFPAFFIFIFIAYIITRHRKDGLMVKRLISAAMGAIIVVAVILLPNILDGTLSDCFSFLTNRVDSGLGSGLGAIETYGTMMMYVLFLVASAILAFKLHSGKNEDGMLDRRFMAFMLVNTAVLFLYPSTPQYVLLLIPFVIYAMMCLDTAVKIPYIAFCIGSTIFALSSNFMLFLSFGAYTDLMSVSSLMPLMDSFQQPLILGITGMQFMYYGGAVVQYAATICLFLLMLTWGRHGRTDVWGSLSIGWKWPR